MSDLKMVQHKARGTPMEAHHSNDDVSDKSNNLHELPLHCLPSARTGMRAPKTNSTNSSK